MCSTYPEAQFCVKAREFDPQRTYLEVLAEKKSRKRTQAPHVHSCMPIVAYWVSESLNQSEIYIILASNAPPSPMP